MKKEMPKYYHVPGIFRKYMKAKKEEILSRRDQDTSKEPSLIGRHREYILEEFLEEFLPKRYGVGKGIIFDSNENRSCEADIVIWDALNCPNLTLRTYSNFFVESVLMVIETKSNYSDVELKKCITRLAVLDSLIRIDSFVKLFPTFNMGVPRYDPDDPAEIPFGVIFYTGGESFNCNKLKEFKSSENFPEIILFLDAGKVVIKANKKNNEFLFIQAKKDCFLIFSVFIHHILEDKAVDSKKIVELLSYLDIEKTESFSC